MFAGTILENGTIQIKANKVGEDTTFNKIIALVEEAQDAKSKTERFIDRFKRLIFKEERIRGKDVGTITIFLDDVRIATNVLDEEGKRAVGTMV